MSAPPLAAPPSTSSASVGPAAPLHPKILHGAQLRLLALGALGVVFGDIGTSPLYALKECVSSEHGVPASPENVYGLLSLIFWALTMVVTVKYLTFIMRADNNGEGGILALLALVPERLRQGKHGTTFLAAVILFGAALLYGDGIITPAISVLSAVEGLEVAAPKLQPYIVPITCLVLIGLFAIQSRGTGDIGKIFGPIMMLWFSSIGILGVIYIARDPAILGALSPLHAVRFFLRHGKASFIVLGSVVLAITGGEALYADMGHFGARSIRLAWYGLVMPALVLNYFGQGALLLQKPEAAGNPFFAMVPAGGLTYALVALSTVATVIASQALISGAFSLTHQATQLGYLPRVSIKHTSSHTEGQIYIGSVNWALAVCCLALVLGFRESSRLASAYGIAVTGTMGITSVVYFVVLRVDWKWPLWKALPLLVLFLCFDLPFFGANLLKLVDGGYVPILVATIIFSLMMIWRRGRTVLIRRLNAVAPPVDKFIRELDHRCGARVPGTAVFFTAQLSGIPAVLEHYVRAARSLHERVILLTVITDRVPRVPAEEPGSVEVLGAGFHRIIVHSGFMEKPHIPDRLCRAAAAAGMQIDVAEMAFFLGHESFLATSRGEMSQLPETIFAFLYRNAASATAYFNLPPEQVVELGMQIDL
jgi:KUP system potassium uptake protein